MSEGEQVHTNVTGQTVNYIRQIQSYKIKVAGSSIVPWLLLGMKYTIKLFQNNSCKLKYFLKELNQCT